jgi:prephenate dehydrogenase
MSTFSSQNKKSVLGIDQSLTPTLKISGFRMSTKILNRKETIWNDILNENTVKKIIEPRKKSGEDEDMLPKQRMLELKRTILKEKDKMKDVIDSLKRQQIMSKDKLKTFISNLHMQKVKGLK